MKKTFLMLLLILTLVACVNGEYVPAEDAIQPDLVIADMFFAQQMHDIFLNPGQYLGQVIRYEGVFLSAEWNDEMFFAVAQNVPSCCSPDGMLGLEILLEDREPFEDDAWVEVTGVLEEDDNGFLLLRTMDIREAVRRD